MKISDAGTFCVESFVAGVRAIYGDKTLEAMHSFLDAAERTNYHQQGALIGDWAYSAAAVNGLVVAIEFLEQESAIAEANAN